jgi:lipoprotein-anchoring transpeptidase ErfK/SrfK
MRRARLVGPVIALILALTCWSRPAAAAPTLPAFEAILPADMTAVYFEATGHNLSGPFLRYWWEQGQMAIFGAPVSEEMTEDGRTVQYFERARFEAHPEHQGTAAEVQLTHLGRRAAPWAHPAFLPVAPTGESIDRDYVAATGHTLSYAFRAFWEQHNGLQNFGYPISEEFDLEGRTVQYFERARFEFFPEADATPGEVQLTALGRQAAQGQDISLLGAAPRAGATTWTPTLAAETGQRLRETRQRAALTAVATPVTPFQAVVTVPVADLRAAPTTIAARTSYTYARHIVHVTGLAIGEPVAGNDQWYQVSPSGAYIPAAAVGTFTPPSPPVTWQGRWIDVNLSRLYITAYEGTTPLYSALITAGRENRTPLGIFSIQYRVRTQTLDSATVGIPKGHREYYYLPNTQYVQYFAAGGIAIHGNYWVHPSRFGNFSSNGCLGLLNADAAWFWSFASMGTPVHVHY